MAAPSTHGRIAKAIAAVARARAIGASEDDVAKNNDAADRAVTTIQPVTFGECVAFLDLIMANDGDTFDAVPRRGLERLRAGLKAAMAD